MTSPILPRLVSFMVLAAVVGAPTAAAADYAVSKVIHIGGAGGWDYVLADGSSRRLYVPRSTHTQVVDTDSGKVIADIPGQSHNHGVAVAPSANRGFISDDSESAPGVVVFDLETYAVLGRIPGAADADGIIYDGGTNKVLLVCGDAGKLIPIAPDVDLKHPAAEPAIDLGGKPEFLAADGKGHVFINLVDKDVVVKVDIASRAVTARWPVAPGGSPVGMAIDRRNGRLFVGCRKPQKMIVLSTEDGKVLADLPIGAGVDATAYRRGTAFASCRDGTLTVVSTANGEFKVAQTVTTKPGARTLTIDERTGAIYLPTAEFSGVNAKGRPTPKPDSFMVVVAQPSNR